MESLGTMICFSHIALSFLSVSIPEYQVSESVRTHQYCKKLIAMVLDSSSSKSKTSSLSRACFALVAPLIVILGPAAKFFEEGAERAALSAEVFLMCGGE